MCMIKDCYCQSDCEKRQHRRPGCTCRCCGLAAKWVLWVARGVEGIGLPWALPAGYLQLLFGCSASATLSFTVFTAACLTQLWGERAFICFGIHFSLLAWWQSVFLLPEWRQALFFCAQLQGVTLLFPTSTSKATVWSSSCVTENNNWSRFLTNFDWLVSLVFITFASFSINTHVTVILLHAGDPEFDLLLCYLYSVFVFGISWLINSMLSQILAMFLVAKVKDWQLSL